MMKVLDLRCARGHAFEGWFASEADYAGQTERSLIECPMCADKTISRMLSAPRLNLSGAKAPTEQSAAPSQVAAVDAGSQTTVAPADMQAAWLSAVKNLVANTENVGPRFAEEARRIHYGEKPQRAIRGQATYEERQALQEEGIETVSLPLPIGLDRPVQ